jgi:nitrous oxidase accessory protein NosD
VILSIFLGILLFYDSCNNSVISYFQIRLKLSETSSPIIIDDTNPTRNWSFCVANYEWCSGSGNWSDPYVIKGLYFEDLGYPDSALTIRNSDSVFIARNCIFYNCQFGFYIDNVSNGIITYNSLIAEDVSEEWGWSRSIDLNNCENITVSNNFIIGEYMYSSIELEDCLNISFIRVLGYDTPSKIILSNSNYSEVTACNIGLSLYNSHYNQIKNNSLSEASINLDFCTFNNISKNNISISERLTGISMVYYCSNNSIFQNKLTTGSTGIHLWDNCYSNNITENIIRFENKQRQTDVGDHGISITRGLFNLIDSNNISYYNFGVSLTWSNYSIITNNFFYHTRNCIVQNECSDNFIEGNTCIKPPWIYIFGYPWILLVFIVLGSLIIIIIKLRIKSSYFFK